MTFRTVSRFEKDTFKLADAINQLGSGRTNATGTVTLSTVANFTIVSATSTSTSAPTAPTCAAGSAVWLSPMTANAAFAASFAFVNSNSTDVSKGAFTIRHSSSTTTDRTYAWVVLG